MGRLDARAEETAAFMAGAEAQLTGQLAVCAGSCGPGNLHLINGLYDAHRSMAPSWQSPPTSRVWLVGGRGSCRAGRLRLGRSLALPCQTRHLQPERGGWVLRGRAAPVGPGVRRRAGRSDAGVRGAREGRLFLAASAPGPASGSLDWGLGLGVGLGPFADADRPMAVLVGMLGVAAMATQNALVKLALKDAPSTAVMTTNITQLTVDLATLVRRQGGPTTSTKPDAGQA